MLKDWLKKYVKLELIYIHKILELYIRYLNYTEDT